MVDRLKVPKLPWRACPRCGGSLIVAKFAWTYDLECLQCSHTLADWKPGLTEWRLRPCVKEATAVAEG